MFVFGGGGGVGDGENIKKGKKYLVFLEKYM